MGISNYKLVVQYATIFANRIELSASSPSPVRLLPGQFAERLARALPRGWRPVCWVVGQSGHRAGSLPPLCGRQFPHSHAGQRLPVDPPPEGWICNPVQQRLVVGMQFHLSVQQGLSVDMGAQTSCAAQTVCWNEVSTVLYSRDRSLG